MKKNVHPVYYEDTKVVCACGNSFTTSSNKKLIQIEVCNKCHPFYTGKHRYLDVEGRVEMFKKKQEKAKEYLIKLTPKKKEKKEAPQPKTLRELLETM